MIVPAIPAESMSKYFTEAELQLIFEKGKVKLREALRRWAADEKMRLRIYYKPTRGIFSPEVAFHLDDVLTLGTQTGLLRVRQELIDETLAARAELPPVVLPVLWQRSPRLVAQRRRPYPRPRAREFSTPHHVGGPRQAALD